METYVAGLPPGWKNIARDSRGNVAVFDFRGIFAPTTESTIQLFSIQNFTCVLN